MPRFAVISILPGPRPSVVYDTVIDRTADRACGKVRANLTGRAPVMALSDREIEALAESLRRPTAAIDREWTRLCASIRGEPVPDATPLTWRVSLQAGKADNYARRAVNVNAPNRNDARESAESVLLPGETITGIDLIAGGRTLADLDGTIERRTA